MKLLTIIVPSYNSEKTLAGCLDSLIIDSDKLEVLVVNDGSKDNTSKIAHEYEAKYPHIFKAIDQVNKGHGGAINTGVDNATGVYVRVLDSDDHLNKDALLTLLNKINYYKDREDKPTTFFTDFIFEFANGKINEKPLSKYMPANQIITSKDIKKFASTDMIMIHNISILLDVVKSHHMHICEKTSYDDFQYVYFVLANSKTFYYIDKVMYRYFIGTSTQSVSNENVARKYEDYLKVIVAISTSLKDGEYMKLDKYSKRLLLHTLFNIYITSSYSTYLVKDKQRRINHKNYLSKAKENTRHIYKDVCTKTPYISQFFIPPFLKRPVMKVFGGLIRKKLGWN